MRSALVCEAGGFFGGHLVTRLTEDVWVRGVDSKHHEYNFRGLERSHAWIEQRARWNAAYLAA